MSTNESWAGLTSCPCNRLIVPSGTDINNYIVMDAYNSLGIGYIHKYNTDTDKWNQINGCINIKKNAWFSAALDVKKHLLYLSNKDSVTQIHLNNLN
eukprot:192487_1